MSRLQAAALREQDAHQAVIRALDRLDQASNRARLAVLTGGVPAMTTLGMRVSAIEEALRIWDACATALTRCESESTAREMRSAI